MAHKETHSNNHGHSHENVTNCCGHGHDSSGPKWETYFPVGLSLVLLLSGIALDHYFSESFNGIFRLSWYLFAYIPVGFPVIKEGIEAIMKKNFFNEFTLMVIATLGAFGIKEYPEGVAVMLFYSIGELFQDSAVKKAQNNIKSLLDIRPNSASVFRAGSYSTVNPADISVGEQIQVKAGEKISLDGALLSESGSFNTSALTGESRPKTIRKGESVLAGMISIDKVIEVKVEKKFSDSSLSRILDMVQNASSRKAKTELLIRKFAKIYTPIVFFLALALVIIPYFIVSDYIFKDWLYKSLVFLVISCPCALVISIPLGYFGGIGAASKNGILFKGANFLDIMTSVNNIVMDKTGTLTKGVFKVQEVNSEINEKKFVGIVAALEKFSTHPIAKAIVEYANTSLSDYPVKDVAEISGHGIKGYINGEEILIGNSKLMIKFNIDYNKEVDDIVETTIIASIDGKYAGYIVIADEVKEDALQTVKELHNQGIKQITILSGDKSSITEKIAQKLDIDSAYGDLLPENKVEYIEKIKAEKSNIVAFVGDGINDAPALALSDVGIAMGGMGSDAAIEVADVIIQTDQPSKITTAIKIAKSTKHIVYQNIAFAFGVKIIVLFLGAFDVASMWEAVFADVGVALLAILNAVRIINKKFS